MDLRQIRYFTSVCATGSFSRAAVSLNISQSALSKQVRQLEESLGVLLLIRDGRGVHLTPKGAILYERFSNVEAQLAEARVAMIDTTEKSKTIAIGATPLLGAEFLSRLIMEIRQMTAFTSIRLIEGYSQQINAMLRAGDIDIAMAYDLTPGPHAEQLGELHQGLSFVSLADAPGYGEASLEMPFAKLANHQIITFDPPSRVRSLLQKRAEALGMTLTFRHAIDSLSLILALVRQGEGVTVLPASALDGQAGLGIVDRRIIGQPLGITLQVAAALRSGISTDVYSATKCISNAFALKSGGREGSWSDTRWTPFR